MVVALIPKNPYEFNEDCDSIKSDTHKKIVLRTW